mmetsp:Transcript_13083/g.40290  ORF Transcript_13083/g.40290 Transcript_13083/m.40290 type:complete len:201 (+) Transcript_13083:1387-1989(+)
MLSLEVWFSGSHGPGGQSTRSKLLACDATLLAMQNELSSLPTMVDTEALSRRIAILENTTTDTQCHSEDLAQLACNQVEQFRHVLADTSQSIEKVQLELATKASQADTLKSLDRLALQMVELAAATVGKHQLQKSLKSKVDHRDLGKVAMLIASGELSGLKAAVYGERSARPCLAPRPGGDEAIVGCSQTSIPEPPLPLL